MEIKASFFLNDSYYLPLDNENKDIHIVCPASNGLTHLNCIAGTFVGSDELNALVDDVNNSGVAATLYPSCRVTILPSESISPRNDLKEMLSENIRRCVSINEESVKSRFIYFIDDQMETPEFFAILKEAVENMEGLVYTEKIICRADLYLYEHTNINVNDFLLYYNIHFRKDLKRFSDQIKHNPSRGCYSTSSKNWVKYEHLTNAHNYLRVVEQPENFLNFGVALYFNVLLDQVLNTYFREKIEQFVWNYRTHYYYASHDILLKYFDMVKFIGENYARHAHPKFILKAMSNGDEVLLNDFKTKLNEVSPLMKSEMFDLFRLNDIGIDGTLFWEKCQDEINNTLQFIEENINNINHIPMPYFKLEIQKWNIKYGQIKFSTEDYQTVINLFLPYMDNEFTLETFNGSFSKRKFNNNSETKILRLSCNKFFGDLNEGDIIYFQPIDANRLGVYTTQPADNPFQPISITTEPLSNIEKQQDTTENNPIVPLEFNPEDLNSLLLDNEQLYV